MNMQFSDSNSTYFPQEPCSVSIYETRSIDLRKHISGATLVANVALAEARHKISVIFAIGLVYYLAVTTAVVMQSEGMQYAFYAI